MDILKGTLKLCLHTALLLNWFGKSRHWGICQAEYKITAGINPPLLPFLPPLLGKVQEWKMRHKFCNPAPDGSVAKQVTVGKELQVQPAECFADSGDFLMGILHWRGGQMAESSFEMG